MRSRPLAAVFLAGLSIAGSRLLADDPTKPHAPAPTAPVAPPRFVAARRGAERDRTLAREGGTVSTEKAVEAGLDWLMRHQSDDGGWDADGFAARCRQPGPTCDGLGKGQHGEDMPCPFDAAISALATLAFLGAGHGPWVEGDRFATTVEKALARLEAGGGDVWALALATQALAEAEVLEGKGRFLAAAKTGAERLIAGREQDGGWAYAGSFRAGSDVPYVGLVVPALVAARDVGVGWPPTLAADADRWLASLEVEHGRLAYLKDGRAYGYTPTTANGLTAAAIREWLESGRETDRHRAHMGLARADPPDWTISFKEIDVKGRGKVKVQIGHLSLYEWWYGTMASFQAGGDPWRGWFARLASALVPHQRTDGCARGSWDPLGTYERQTGGRVFSTALCVQMLETPYRHRRLSGK
jgi:hypothetical protein